jgi:cytochrome c biogenesis protein CcmG, thiol:disulfide interchange protein DsbE
MNKPDKPSSMKSTKSTSLMLFVIIGALILGFLIMMGLWIKNPPSKVIKTGQSIPDFSLTSFSGDSYKLSELRGKIVLINVWASWCVTCDEEAFMLQTVWSEVENRDDFLFLGLDYVDTDKPALEFMETHGITFPNGPDIGSNISEMLHVQGVPESYLIGRDGTLKGIQIGPFSSLEQIRNFLALASE